MTREELIMLQALPLEIKVAKTKLRIREFVEKLGRDSVHVAFSAGKDSTVLAGLVHSIYPDVPLVFSNTGLEFPKIVEFAKKYNSVVIKPEVDFRTVILNRGYPMISKEFAQYAESYRNGAPYAIKSFNGERLYNGEKSRYNLDSKKYLLDAPFDYTSYCCNILKKNPLKNYEKQTGSKPIIGTLAAESVRRETSYLVTGGCNSFSQGKEKCQPLGFWTEQDILQYIKQNNLEICSVYGDVIDVGGGKLGTTKCKRTGCVFCGFGCHNKGDNRWSELKEQEPKLYEYCMKPVSEGGLGYAEVLDWLEKTMTEKKKWKNR